MSIDEQHLAMFNKLFMSIVLFVALIIVERLVEALDRFCVTANSFLQVIVKASTTIPLQPDGYRHACTWVSELYQQYSWSSPVQVADRVRYVVSIHANLT